MAGVRLELSPAHLDRVFDYLVPDELDASARPGVRCTVMFGGRRVPGFVVERRATSDHPGLRPLLRVPSDLPVLTPEVLALAEAVATEQAGTVSDVLRLAIPPRHARTEKSVRAGLATAPDVGHREQVTDGSGDGVPEATGVPADHREEQLATAAAIRPDAGGDRHATGEAAGSGRADSGRDSAGAHGPVELDGPVDVGGPLEADGPGGADGPVGADGATDETLPDGASDPDLPWRGYRAGPAFWSRLRAGHGPRAVWAALPSQPAHTDWPAAIASAAIATAQSGRGTLITVPDHRDVDRVLAALSAAASASLLDRVARLTADLGPAPRYRAFLRVLLGEASIVVGTRAAAFAPVHRLGLVVCWDDGDDLHIEPRAPYPHTRDVLRLRAEQSGAAALFGGFAVSVADAHLVRQGWARPLVAERAVLRAAMPRIGVSGDDDLRDAAARTARIPSVALRALRAGLGTATPSGPTSTRRGPVGAPEPTLPGPVLVQVPHVGYVRSLTCQQCRRPARCQRCRGPMEVARSDGPVHCGWCGQPESLWRCPECAGTRLRAVRVGSTRTAEEIGRALPGVPVRVSSSQTSVLPCVPDEPALVVATAGAEPVAAAGYAAAVLLDGWVPLARPELDAPAHALSRWMAAAALVRPAAQGGRVVIVADAAARAVQALVRWDPLGWADRELADRVELGFPPAGVLAEVVGVDLSAFVAAARLPRDVEVVGPYPTTFDSVAGSVASSGSAPQGSGALTLEPADSVLGWDDPDLRIERALIRAAAGERAALAAALRAARAVASAGKRPAPRVRMQTQSV